MGDSAKCPVATGVLDYFPDALREVAKISKLGNEQHNPGTLLHWDRSKSTDDANPIISHFMQRGAIDTDGGRHSAKLAWRALALLQKELEAAGLSLPTRAALTGTHSTPQPTEQALAQRSMQVHWSEPHEPTSSLAQELDDQGKQAALLTEEQWR